MTTYPTIDRLDDLADLRVPGGPASGPAPRRVPVADRVTSLLGLGPIPPTQVVMASALVAESNRVEPVRGDLTPAERVARARRERRALRGLERALSRPIEKRVRRLKPVFARINLLTSAIEALERSPLVGADGERLTPAEAQARHDSLEQVVTDSVAGGSQRHVVSRGRRSRREIGTLAIDFPVFLLAMLGLLNVSTRKVLAGDPAAVVLGVTAVVFALLGTVLLAVVMRAMGRRHRRFKGDAGSIQPPADVRRTVRLELAALAVVLAAAATVMAARLYVEGRAAEAPMILVLALAALFAVLLGVSAYLNYVSELQDGSDVTDRVRHLAAQLLGRDQNLRSLRNARDLLVEEAGIVLAALRRAIDAALERATQVVTTSAADRAILIARSYAGRTDPLPAPKLTSPRIAHVEDQAAELAAHHALLVTQLSDGTDTRREA